MFLWLFCSLWVVGWTQPVQKDLYLAAPIGSRPNCIPKGQTFCTEVNNYPTDLILRLLEGFNSTSVFVDESKGLQEPPEYLISGGSRRFIRSVCDKAVPCPTQKKIIKPKAAVNSKGEWKFVTSGPVVVEICTDADESVKSVQRYKARKLNSLDNKGRSLKGDWFILPSCCSCYRN